MGAARLAAQLHHQHDTLLSRQHLLHARAGITRFATFTPALRRGYRGDEGTSADDREMLPNEMIILCHAHLIRWSAADELPLSRRAHYQFSLAYYFI